MCVGSERELSGEWQMRETGKPVIPDRKTGGREMKRTAVMFGLGMLMIGLVSTGVASPAVAGQIGVQGSGNLEQVDTGGLIAVLPEIPTMCLLIAGAITGALWRAKKA